MNLLKSLWKWFLSFRKSPKKLIITVILGAIIIALSLYSANNRRRQSIDYHELLGQTAITVNGQSRTFDEVAYYVAYEEDQVQQEALAYDVERPDKYWNLHINGIWVRIAARNAAIEMAIHDELFYQMAVAEGIELSEEELQALANAQQDAWADLTMYDKQELLGVTKQDVYDTIERMMYAQKFQYIYACLNNDSYESYDFSTDTYRELLEQQDTSFEEDLWKQLQFGAITLQ